MFRRKRYSEPAASIPWWPTAEPNRPSGRPGAHGGPGGFGPDGFGTGGFGPGGPGGFGPSTAPPLASHDPFGGWPAFGDEFAGNGADGYSGRGAGNGDGDQFGRGAEAGGMSGPGHPANGWPLVEGYAGAADPFGAPAAHPSAAHPSAHPAAGHPSAHPGVAHPPNARPASGHPSNGHPSNDRPTNGHPADPWPVNGRSAIDSAAAFGAVPPGAPIEAESADAARSEGVPDWIPLLTHPIGGQRFQPDLEAAPDPTASDAAASDAAAHEAAGSGRNAGPAAGRPPRRRNGRRPKAHRPQGARVEDREPEAAMTTWIPTIGAAEPGPAPSTEAPHHTTSSVRPDPATLATPDPAEASSLAGAFAADYLSWDQDNPARRGQVLAQYLPTDVKGDPSLLGWSGKGRQRSEFSLPGAVHPDGDGRVLVDVRVRVTPFRQVGPADRVPAPAPEAKLEVAGVPAVAPAPSARGWKSQDSHWVRLTVPVTRDQGRLVVDTWDEQLGEDSGDDADDTTGNTGVDPRDADDPGTADDADDAAGPTTEREDQ